MLALRTKFTLKLKSKLDSCGCGPYRRISLDSVECLSIYVNQSYGYALIFQESFPFLPFKLSYNTWFYILFHLMIIPSDIGLQLMQSTMPLKHIWNYLSEFLLSSICVIDLVIYSWLNFFEALCMTGKQWRKMDFHGGYSA